MKKIFENIFTSKYIIDKNIIKPLNSKFKEDTKNSLQTNKSFSEKWKKYESSQHKDSFYEMQKEWYLKLYGFETIKEFTEFLQSKKIIFDAGCGLGFKAKWFADLAPKSTIIAMDYSDAIDIASKNYQDVSNLFFIRGDIASLPFKDNSIDYISCDQVIMHTKNPEDTFKELTRVLNKSGDFACYVYAKKALPRELLDNYFREQTKSINDKDMWEMSEQLTQLGKVLSELNISVDFPDIPLLGIKGGKQDLQRFIYWNFLKCFWNDDLGYDTSLVTNYDWYSPSNAKRYSESEFKQLIALHSLTIKYFHSEEACYSGRFKKEKRVK
nr:class I SAM-dependent methyltransferase [uncultured Sulfurimonas sp.]